MRRQLQCVWPCGFDCRVASRTALMRSGPYHALRPRPGAISHRLFSPSATKRSRHSRTVLRLICSADATAASDSPPATASTLLRCAHRCQPLPDLILLILRKRKRRRRTRHTSLSDPPELYVQLFIGHYTSCWALRCSIGRVQGMRGVSTRSDFHWNIVIGTSGGCAEDEAGLPVGRELSQSNPGRFES